MWKGLHYRHRNPKAPGTLTPSLQPYSGNVRVRTTSAKTGGNSSERLFGTRKTKCSTRPGAPILRARRDDDAAAAACCQVFVELRPWTRPVTDAPTALGAPGAPTPRAPVAGATAGTPLPTWLLAVVTALPTVVTALPTTTTTGAVGLPGAGGVGDGEPAAPPVPEPVGPLWGAAGDGTNATVVPGGTSTVTTGGSPLCPAWVSCPVRNACRAPVEPDDAASVPLALAGPGDSPAGELERPPGIEWEPVCGP